MSPIVDNRLEKLDDLLLTSRSGVELSAHLGESLIDPLESLVDLLEPLGEVLPKVDEVLPHGVEAGRRGPAKVAQLAADLANIAIGGTGKHPGGRGVLLVCMHPSSQIAHLTFEVGDAWLEIVGLHRDEPTAGPPQCRPLICSERQAASAAIATLRQRSRQ